MIVYASAWYQLPALLAGVRSVTGATAVIGASSSGQFHDGGATLNGTGPGVSVLAMTAGGYRFGVASVSGLAGDPFTAGYEVTRAARAAVGDDAPAHGALLVLTSGQRGDPQAMLSGIYRVAGAAVGVVGGAASDDGAHTGTFVFDGNRVLDDAVVAVWIASPHPTPVAVANGWRAEGLPMLVTQVDGHRIGEIAGRPAAEVFRESFLEPLPARDDQHPRQCAAHAFGLVEPDGTQVIRGATIDGDGVLRTWAPVPLYSAVRVVSCEPEQLLAAAEQAAAAVLAPGGARLLLAFGCTARAEILGERCGEEAKRLQAAAGDVPTFGFYTYGEFARTTSVAGYHNAAVATLAL